jgi:hypothetical protein
MKLQDELEDAVTAIDAGLLAFASPEANAEWDMVRARCQQRSAGPQLADSDLAFLVPKIRRFGEILRGLGAARQSSFP